mmetsp:Transcript_61594/g.199424  ORF Transcript_61594/g.199424 Transcript_61594/m.199424 type:complete len:340 (-) Transcript_61594:916-1935(-)
MAASATSLLPEGRDSWSACSVGTLRQLRAASSVDAPFFREHLVAVYAKALDGESLDVDDAAIARAQAALRSLVVVTGVKDEQALEAMCRCLTSPYLAGSACMALSRIASKPGAAASVASATAVCSAHASAAVRCSAVKVWEEVAKCGEVEAVQSIARALDPMLAVTHRDSPHPQEDRDASVRRAAVTAMAELTSESQSRHLDTAIIGVAKLLEHDEPSVRDSAVAALTSIGVTAERAVVDAVAERMEHPREDVRLTARRALELIFPQGHEAAVRAAAARLAHQDAVIRCCALEALLVIADQGQSSAAMAALSALEDSDPEVQALAMQLIQKVSGPRARR